MRIYYRFHHLLQQQVHFSVEQLRDHLEEKYQVVYKSRQSYYDLLEAGGLSWKKTQKKNPQAEIKLSAEL
ncbi:MAG: winged helix-turn-helix domain-containing protein [Pseudomonadota bacterium]|nr:winged helix-turn-helix domain-containing protein [Pseudomonadota bacterium]